MKRKFTILFTFVACMLCIVSCDEEYDLSKDINQEINVGGEHLSLPIGSTEKIVLKELLDLEEGDDFLKILEGGNYSLSYKDSVEVDGLEIDAVSIDGISPEVSPFYISAGDFTIPDITIPGKAIDNTISLGEVSVEIKDFSVKLDKSVEKSLPLTVNSGFDIDLSSFTTLDLYPISNTTTFSFGDIDFGDKIQTIERIYFGDENSPGSIFEFKVNAKDLLSNLDDVVKKSVKNVKLVFPENTTLESVSGDPGTIIDNNYSVSSAEFVDGIVLLKVRVKSMEYKPNDMSVSFYVEKIDIKGRVKNDISKIKIAIECDNMFKFQSADIKTKDIKTIIPKKDIDIVLPINNIENIDKINHITFESGAIEMQIDAPQGLPSPLAVTDCKDLVVKFPAEIIFGEIAGFDKSTNTLSLTKDNMFEKHILPIKRLNVDKDVEDGSVEFGVKVEVKGEFIVGQASVNTSKLLGENTVSYKASILESVIKYDDASVVTSAVPFKITSEEMKPIKIDVVEGGIPIEIRKLYTVDMVGDPGVLLEISTVFEGLPKSIDKIRLQDFKIEFPDIFVFDDDEQIGEDNVCVFNEDIKNKDGIFTFNKTLYLKSFDLGQDNTYLLDSLHPSGETERFIKLNKEITITGTIEVPSSTISSSELGQIKCSPSVSLGEMTFAKVTGVFNPTVEPINESFEFEDIPEFLLGDNVNLDFISPVLKFEVSNSLNIPVTANATVVPMIGGLSQKDSISVELDIKSAEVSGVPIYSQFWLSDSDAGMPAGWTHSDNDIGVLLERIPDSLRITVGVDVDTTVIHSIDLNDANYELKVKYEIDVPLALGKEFAINYTDTIKDLGKDLEDVIDKVTSLSLSIDVENSVPLNMSIVLKAVDVDFKEIPGIIIEGITAVAPGVIKAGELDENAEDGSGTKATKSQLEVVLTEDKANPGALAKLDHFLLVIDAKTSADGVVSTAGGASLNENQYIRLKLSAKIPGGINIDLDE